MAKIDFNVASKKQEFEKGVKSNIENSLIGEFGQQKVDITKAGMLNPNLVLTHIIDKNGHHTIRYKRRDVSPGVGERHHHVKPGDKVYLNGEELEVLGVKEHGYLKVKDKHGRVFDRSIKKLQFRHPDGSGMVRMSGETDSRKVISGAELPEPESVPETTSREQEVSDVGLDYEVYGTPKERMEDWVDLIEGFANDESKNLVVAYGTGGVGKTYNVMKNDVIKEGLANGSIVKFTGGTTPAGFLEMLYNNRDKKIILDDFDMVFNDPKMLNVLSVLSRSDEERIVTKPTSSSDSGDVPPAFEFTGKIMVISNIDIEDEAKSGNNAGYFEAILANSGKVNLKMTKKETWDLINNYILHKDGKVNHDLKFRDSIGQEIEATDEDREELSQFFKNNWENMIELSGRTLAKANAIQQFYKQKGADWQEKAKKILLKGGGEGDSVDERFLNFNDSIDMIGEGLMKSAIIVDKNANKIVERLKAKGFKKTAINGGWELQKQSDPDYLPGNSEETFVTDMFHVVTSQMTEKAFYETLWKHNGKVIIFDKSAKNILKSDLGQGLMKGALDTSGDGDVAWLSKTDTGKYPVPKQEEGEDHDSYATRLRGEGFKFEQSDNGRVDRTTISHPYDLSKNFKFKGRCIFITDSKDDAAQPIQSRSMIADINTNPKEFIQLAERVAQERERLGKQFSHILRDATIDEYKTAINILKNNIGKINERNFDEEGIQTVMTIVRKKKHLLKTEEGMKELNKRVVRALGVNEVKKSLDYNSEDLIVKAFLNLIEI